MSLKNVKVGDKVFTLHHGWTTVKGIDWNSKYTVIIGGITYTREGKQYDSDVFSSAWSEDTVPQFFLDKFPKPKIKHSKHIEFWVNVYPTQLAESFSVGTCRYDTEELAKENADFDNTPYRDWETLCCIVTGKHYVVS